MTKAYILIETAVGKTRDVVAALRPLEGVKSVDTVTGPYDVIAIVEGEALNEIGDLVTEKIHPIKGISRTVTCLAIALAGGAEFRWTLRAPAALAALAGPFIFYAVFAAAEELIMRGYPIKVLDASWNRAAAILVTSVAFGLLHLFNPSAGFLPAVNVTLAGVILGLLYLQSGSLWLAIGFHWGWNFAEGSVFGFAVSGYRFPGRLDEAAAQGPAWLSGAGFGPEGSVVLTAASAALIALALTRKLPYPPTPAGGSAGGNAI